MTLDVQYAISPARVNVLPKPYYYYSMCNML
jgi:hypothetical protein